MSKQGKRKYDRIYLDCPVKIEFHSKRYDHCQIKNLSLTGMFVKGTFRQKVDEYCLVTFFQRGITSKSIFLALANVVRATFEGVAIEFTSMSFESYMILQTTLPYAADEPINIGLELPEQYPFEISEQKLTIPAEKVC